MKKVLLFAGIVAIFLFLYPPGGLGQHSEESVEFKLRLFSKVLRYIKTQYVEEEDISELIERTIDQMLHDLDPYSDLLTPEEWEELNISTTGEFGGIGIQIGIRDKILTIIAPIEGTPAYRAGLMAGDHIIEVEGESTRGWTLQKAVKNLRGEPGTKVSIKIGRPGVEKPIPVSITREVIQIKAVPYFSMLTDDIGYIRLSDFSEKASPEIKSAIDDLKQEGMSKLILDLRNNPGGLLKGAVEVADIFIPKDKDIVFTKGRRTVEREYQSLQDDGFSEKIPLVVLVNKGSASASEIVSGALQDWDRALVIGDTTFGKGSVQRLFPLEGKYRLRLTTSKYYIPSGRSIHREHKEKDESEKKTETIYFKTLELKRDVPGGFGIVPDVVLPQVEYSPTVKKIQLLFFKFAVEHYNTTGNAEVTDEVLKKFYNFVAKEIEEIKIEDLEKAEDEITFLLKAELKDKEEGIKGRYEVILKEDPWIKEAEQILEGAREYTDVFSSLEK